MTLPEIPPIDLPFFNAEQSSKILFQNRSTLLGIVNRYIDPLRTVGMAPVKSGSTRRFSMFQLGVLSVIKNANAVNVGLDAMLSIDLIAPHVWASYEAMMPLCTWDAENSSDAAPRLHIPEASPPDYLVGRQFFGDGWKFAIQKFPTEEEAKALRDLGGFPSPVLLFSLDELLRNTWTRAILIANGLELGSGAE